jgi:aryl-alcohol dehydrogenase-like predicted oxidoreductase
MNYRTLPGTALRVSELCLGTMTWGEQTPEREAHAQADCAVAHGVNFIDTAEMYPVPPGAKTYGRTETILGAWLARRPRDKLIVASKVAGPGRSREWVRGGETALTRKNIKWAIDDTLRRLRTDYVDLYQIHWPERNVAMFGTMRYDAAKEKPATPILEQIEAMDELIRAGKVRHYGLSNETAWGVCEFARLAKIHGLPQPVTIQNAYSFVNRTFEWDLAEACHREGLALLAYSPLAMGVLAGKYLDGARPPGARFTLFPSFGDRYQRELVTHAAGEYARVARAAGLEPAQLALAFVRSRPIVAATIVGARTVAQLEANLATRSIALADDVVAAIEAVNARYPSPSAGL